MAPDQRETGENRRNSAPQDATERPPDDGAADRATHRATQCLAEIGGDLPRDPVGDRPGDLACDQLTGAQFLAARHARAKNTAERTADRAEDPTASFSALLRFGGGVRHALLQDLVSGFLV